MKIRQLTDTGEWTTRRYLSLLGNVLIWAIVAIDAFYLWPTQLHGSTSMVIVSGHSMEPTYFTGDLVIARKMDPSVGDVIVYAPEGFGGSQIVHRIIGGNAVDGWVMQGDNNPRTDPFTPKASEIRGVVLVHYANFGRVSVLLLNPIVWALVLLAAIVLLVWWSGDTCEEDPEDKDKDTRGDDSDPELEGEDEPDLIDRIVEGTEAAVVRMVSSGVEAGATALAVLTRPSPAPRHAARSPRRAAPAYLRGSAIAVCLGLLAIYAPSTASASSMTINTGGNIFTKSYAPCTTATLGVTYSGTAASGTNYPSMAITGLNGCQGLKLSYTVYGSAGQTLASGTNITVVAGTNVLSPGGTYDASLVQRVAVTVNGWPLTTIWTGPPVVPPTPAPFACDGILMSNGQVVTGTNCTLSGTVQYYWLNPSNGGPAYYGSVNASTAFGPSGYMSSNGWVNYQDITLWRYTIDLTTMGGSAQYMNSLSNGFYLYKNGNNTTLAPGEDCSDATSVTFQEEVAGSNPSSSFVVSPKAITWMAPSSLLCHG